MSSEELISESTIEECYTFFSESEDSNWKDEPLLIPDREADAWDKTHPLEQIRWTMQWSLYKCRKSIEMVEEGYVS